MRHHRSTGRTRRGAWAWFAWSAAGLLVLAASGCRTGSTAPPAPGPDPIALEDYPRVVAYGGIAPFLVVSEPTVRDEAGQLLRVSVPVRAATERDNLQVQYRFIFFDADGFELRSQEQWTYTVIPQGGQRMLESTALSREASDWRLEVRKAR